MNHGLSFFNGLFTMAIVALILVWGVTSLTNDDPLWFLSSFDAQAEEITVYWEGKTMTVKATDPGYADIMQTFAEAISKPVAYEERVGFSEESINLYKENYKLLEVKFQQPVQVHTRYPYTKAQTFLVPLDKTHSLTRRIFSFTGYVPYAIGPLNVKDTAFNDLYTAVESAAAFQ